MGDDDVSFGEYATDGLRRGWDVAVLIHIPVHADLSIVGGILLSWWQSFMIRTIIAGELLFGQFSELTVWERERLMRVVSNV